MIKRKLLLLNLINKFDKCNFNYRTPIVKALFLLKKEYDADKLNNYYSFYPYKYGPFSQLSYADLRKLEKDNFVKSENIKNAVKVKLTKNGRSILDDNSLVFKEEINQLIKRFNKYYEIKNYVYKKYPEYTIKSKLKQHKKKKEKGFYTIGYEKKDIDTFLNILIQNNIVILIDVRKNAFSMNFCYVKSKLSNYLKDVDIDYVHLPELGVDSELRKNLKTKSDYKELFKLYRKKLLKKKEELDKVIHLGKNKKIALLCFEKDVSCCHRGEIAKYIEKQNYEVVNL